MTPGRLCDLSQRWVLQACLILSKASSQLALGREQKAAGFKTPCLLQLSQLWSQQLTGVQKSFISLHEFWLPEGSSEAGAGGKRENLVLEVEGCESSGNGVNQNVRRRTSSVVQWLRIWTSTAGAWVPSPGWATKTPRAPRGGRSGGNLGSRGPKDSDAFPGSLLCFQGWCKKWEKVKKALFLELRSSNLEVSGPCEPHGHPGCNGGDRARAKQTWV